VKTRFGSEFAGNVHSSSRQEGRYISASAQEKDFGFQALEDDGVEVELNYGIDRGSARGDYKVDTVAGELAKQSSASEIWVVNFYYFVSIEDPHLEVARHTSFLEVRQGFIPSFPP
jgi:hypothetical protein